MKIMKATLESGAEVEYVLADDPPSGTMKRTYFTPDRSKVIQFFFDQSVANDPNRLHRLKSILTSFNPTLTKAEGGNAVDKVSADYFKKIFCWPLEIVVKPEFGIIAPTYPGDFFFSSGPWKGKEKEAKWFTSPKLRGYLPPQEKGDWKGSLMICICLARAVRRLHQAGLAHSDLSNKNVLIDPISGRAIVIDIDSLVVPGLFPPDVLGTPGYIAPEVIATQHLPLDDKSRKSPCRSTDEHALAVLMYEYLLCRHPLKGPKVNSTLSAEEDERLSLGEKAVFIDHPTDKTNALKNKVISIDIVGPFLKELFEKTFIKGLHAPNDRAGAIDWERGLVKTWDLLYPCSNSKCDHKWFVIDTQKSGEIRCPFCGNKINEKIPVLQLHRETRPGVWQRDGEVVIYNGTQLLKYHAFANQSYGETSDKTLQAYCIKHEGRWMIVNENLKSLTSPAGNRVGNRQGIELKDGIEFKFSQDSYGKMVKVKILN